MVTLCVAFIGQYLHREEKLTNVNLKVIQRNSNNYFRRKPLRVHIKRPIGNKYETTDEITSNSRINTSQKSLSVYIGKLNGNKWKEIGETMGYKCPIIYDNGLTDFFPSLGKRGKFNITCTLQEEDYTNAQRGER